VLQTSKDLLNDEELNKFRVSEIKQMLATEQKQNRSLMGFKEKENNIPYFN